MDDDIVAYPTHPPNLISGYCFTFCISNDFNVYSFGDNTKSQLGHENIITVHPPKLVSSVSNIKMISCGDYHTLCLDFDGNLFSFGSNEYGQLGFDVESIFETHIPQKIVIPPIDYISSGDNFNVCISFDELLYSFGKNEYGQLGLNSEKNLISTPTKIKQLSNVIFIVCGENHTICKQSNGNYYSWGAGTQGQTGLETNENTSEPVLCSNWPKNIISVKCGVQHSIFLCSNGFVYSCGINTNGELGINYESIISSSKLIKVTNLPLIKRIECGYSHSMCVDLDNNLWVFGFNEYGELGLGDLKSRFKPIKHDTFKDVFDLSCGGDVIFIKTFDNEIFACGHNKEKQIGIKTEEENQIIPIKTFIDNNHLWSTNIGKSKQKSARK